MSRETLLKKAYDAATFNGVAYIAGNDETIIQNGMINYAEKHNAKFSKEEMNSYINEQLSNLANATKDFSFQTKIMNA